MLTLLSSKAQLDSNHSGAKPVTDFDIVADSVAFSYMICYLFGKYLLHIFIASRTKNTANLQNLQFSLFMEQNV
jgi:hypothetical protein